MFNTKIRTTIALLAAAFAVAVGTGPIVPAAHALDNTPTISEEGCKAMWDQFALYVRLAKEAYDRGDMDDFNYYLGEARDYKNRAKAGGCDWAQFRPAIIDRLGGRPAGVDSPTVKPGDSSTTGSTAVSPRGRAVDSATAPQPGGVQIKP